MSKCKAVPFDLDLRVHGQLKLTFWIDNRAAQEFLNVYNASQGVIFKDNRDICG